MSLIRHHPAAPLDRYVECFWWSTRSEPQRFFEHMLPSGSAQLVFALHETPLVWQSSASTEPVSWSRGVVHGPQWNHFISGPKPPGAVAGVSFRPGAAAAVLGISMIDLTDRHVPIAELWGDRALGLHAQLMAAGDASKVFRVLEHNLAAGLKRPLLIHPAVAHALMPRSDPWAAARVHDIQGEAGYSAKHFISLFRSAVGLTPKHYYRVKRFTAVLQHLAGESPASLADIAALTGYSDQSHLSREFRDFAGITPTQYRPRGPGSVLHHRAPEPLLRPRPPGKKCSRPMGRGQR